jgi:hypothetical protein
MSTINVSNLAGPSNTGTAATLSSINGGPISGARNRIINGDMRIDQRNAGAAQTITFGGFNGQYTVDRWFAYANGAAITGQRVQGATAGQFRYRFTGSAGNTSISLYQRIEQLNCADLAGTTVTLSADLANSVLTSVSWAAYYANTADSFGTLVAATKTLIATGTFTVSSSIARCSTNISIPAAATTGIEIVFTVGAQASGTWTIGDVQLEAGTIATPFERIDYSESLRRCQRYYQLVSSFSGGSNSATQAAVSVVFQTAMRATPTFGQTGVIQISDSTADFTQSSTGIINLGSTPNSALLFLNNFNGMTTARPAFGPRNGPTTNTITLSSEL